MRSPFRAAALALSALLAGCTTVRVVPLGPERYAPVDPAQVRIFATVAPTRYTEVAILTGVDEIFNNEARLAEKLRRTAARLGANGILLLRDHPGYGEGGAAKGDSSVAVAVGSGYGLGRVIAIRYDPAAAAGGARPGTASPGSPAP